jgi:hypothetical protein
MLSKYILLYVLWTDRRGVHAYVKLRGRPSEFVHILCFQGVDGVR